jgi:hypothetical protein
MERQSDGRATRPIGRLVVLALAGVALSAGTATAQTGDARWLPWLGCWEADGAGTPEDLMVCVRPEQSGVEIATISDGVTASTRTLIADGQSHPIDTEDCTGWQTARFSEDGRRVFLRSEVTCEGGVTRTGSGIMAVISPAMWLDAQSIGLNGETVPRAIRYRPAPTEVARAAGYSVPVDRIAAAIDARLIASADLSLDDVIEASGHVDDDALQAFLAESGQPFDLDAEAITRLADAGVSDGVIDMVVAVSYPQRFAVDREASDAAMLEPELDERARYDRYDPFGWGGYWGWNRYGSCYGWSSLYCDPYRYGYNAYGYGYGRYGYGYTRPVIVVVGGGDDDSRSARAVSGRGYTRGGASSSAGRATSSRPTRTTVTTGRTSTSTAGSTRSSGSSGSTGRTARRKGGGG